MSTCWSLSRARIEAGIEDLGLDVISDVSGTLFDSRPLFCSSSRCRSTPSRTVGLQIFPGAARRLRLARTLHARRPRSAVSPYEGLPYTRAIMPIAFIFVLKCLVVALMYPPSHARKPSQCLGCDVHPNIVVVFDCHSGHRPSSSFPVEGLRLFPCRFPRYFPLGSCSRSGSPPHLVMGPALTN